jgi:hypothetical protein
MRGRALARPRPRERAGSTSKRKVRVRLLHVCRAVTLLPSVHARPPCGVGRAPWGVRLKSIRAGPEPTRTRGIHVGRILTGRALVPSEFGLRWHVPRLEIVRKHIWHPWMGFPSR